MFTTVVTTILSVAFLIVGKLAFIWGPILAMYVAFEMYHHFITDRFILGMSFTLFEIEVPREVEKTPMAMELIFSNAMYHASQKGIWESWIKGAPHFWFSLEMAGIDGVVHFYIRTPSRIRDLIETQVYAQYPQAKVKEVEDYTFKVPYELNSDWLFWACEFSLERPDAYPLKTYKDFGLDKPSDEEQQKIDPITPTIEFLGSLKRGEQVWIQYVIRPAKKAWHSHKTHAHIGWVEASYEEIDNIMAPYAVTMEVGKPMTTKLPFAITEKIKKVQEKVQKLGFDVGIRVCVLAETKYITDSEFLNLRLASRLLFRQFNNPDLNSLIRTNNTQFGATLSDITGTVLPVIKNRMLNAYRFRNFYHLPFWRAYKYPQIISMFFTRPDMPNIFVLNTEELATLFHFPGQVSQAPSFQRIESRVAKPPSNLPI